MPPDRVLGIVALVVTDGKQHRPSSQRTTRTPQGDQRPVAATLSTVAAALKEDYQSAIREQINNKVMFLQQLEKNTEDVVGLEALLALHTQRTSGVGARAEYGTLPTAGNQGYVDARIPLKNNYGRFAISGPLIRAMSNDKGSWERAMKSESTRIVKDVRRDVNRQGFGTSDGKIIQVQAATASTTVTAATTSTTVQARQIEPGMVVDIGTAATPNASASAVTVVSISTASPPVITFATAVTTLGNDIISRSGAGGNGAAQKEVTGLQTIVNSSGTLFGVDPTTAAGAKWVATVDDPTPGTFRSISEPLVAKNMQAADIASGEEITLLISSDGVHRAYANLLTSLKRFQNTVELKGGYAGLEVTAGGGSVGLIWDRDCPSNTMFGLNTAHLIEFYASDWEFMDNDGAVLSRVPNTDAYEATLYKYMEVGTDMRDSHFVIKDITEA